MSDSHDSSGGSPRKSRLTAHSFRFAEKRLRRPAGGLASASFWERSNNSAGSVLPFSIIPSIRLSSLCGPFNRSRMSQQTLTHPNLPTRPQGGAGEGSLLHVGVG